MADDRTRRRPAETPELRRLRRRIDALDRRIVAILNERATLAREAGAGQGGCRPAREYPGRGARARGAAAGDDGQRGSASQADLLALYRRLFSATRALETLDRDAHERAARRDGGGHASRGRVHEPGTLHAGRRPRRTVLTSRRCRRGR